MKPKVKQLRTLFLRHTLATILDGKLTKFRDGFFEFEMLEMFTTRTWSCLYWRSPYKWKKNHQIDVSHLKNKFFT